MPSPKVFVSSTCYDLAIAREQLRSFLLRIGYEPVLSEYSDILYDPRAHTHTSCIQEVPNADIFVVLIGSRFGGRAIPEALSNLDLENLVNSSFDVTVLNDPEKLSITQLEVLKAIDSAVPVFAFVDEKVMHDHYVYQKNKDLVDKIKFPSIDKPETAKYIFEFISFLSHRNKGNSVISFGKIEDIENHLKKQWGSLFQRLLREQREQQVETRKLFTITEQIEDLKTAMISTIATAQNREVARGVIKYRRLSDFLSGINFPNYNVVTEGSVTFKELLSLADIVAIREIPQSRTLFGRSALIKSDGTYYEVRFNQEFINRISIDWNSFITLTPEVRHVIFETISDMGRMGPGIVRYFEEKFEERFNGYLQKGDSNQISIEAFLNEEPIDEIIEL
ncbi:TPA: DUF4062 domain-containing protein [Vibrio cholerae]|uniref:DUF4062 domain-containing protein n=1 Tax=Vibrio cholerae TaxID=666 RepID=UPI002853EE1B|nr:DUF4062 domain-containing protein [Vibrio cholerae]HDV5604248.1 DUF4062 domain-containing protein [Vibrio cholerae]HDV5656441.1 DUF4062 domain-containing protein [Vibrio cholerae]HDV5661019.1 DUF4062 domain-containing protein [Vibrio cholerae]